MIRYQKTIQNVTNNSFEFCKVFNFQLQVLTYVPGPRRYLNTFTDLLYIL